MAKYMPKSVSTELTVADGLTLTHIKTRSFTFTLAQLKYATMADKMFGLPVTRDQVNDVLKSVMRQNRWELFGSFTENYTITFNGYGQFKSVECKSTNTKLTAVQVFNILEQHA